MATPAATPATVPPPPSAREASVAELDKEPRRSARADAALVDLPADDPNTFDIDPCDLARYAKAVRGMRANSASFTDAWVVEFTDDAFVRLDVASDYAFLKIFVDKETSHRIIHNRDAVGTQVPTRVRGGGTVHRNIVTRRLIDTYIDSLVYEKEMYNRITEYLLAIPVCPTFVRYYDFGAGCSADQMLALLMKMDARGKPADVALEDAARYNLWINTIAIASENFEAQVVRPSVSKFSPHMRDDIARSADKIDFFFNTLNPTYNFIATEAMTDSVTLQRVLREYGGLARLRADHVYGICSILIQVLIGIYAMNSVHVFHNDLHTSNVLLVRVDGGASAGAPPASRITTYFVNGEPYSFYHVYAPKIYDFDRAYGTFSDNPILDRLARTNPHVAQSNRAVENRDMIKLLCYVYQTVPAMREHLRAILFRAGAHVDGAVVAELETKYGFARISGKCFLGSRAHGRMPYDFYTNHFNESHVIIHRCFEVMQQNAAEHVRAERLFPLSDYVFTVAANHFSDIEHYAQYRAQTIANHLERAGIARGTAEFGALFDRLMRANVFYDDTNIDVVDEVVERAVEGGFMPASGDAVETPLSSPMSLTMERT